MELFSRYPTVCPTEKRFFFCLSLNYTFSAQNGKHRVTTHNLKFMRFSLQFNDYDVPRKIYEFDVHDENSHE